MSKEGELHDLLALQTKADWEESACGKGRGKLENDGLKILNVYLYINGAGT